MKNTITEYDFIDIMIEEGNGFTYDGAKLLFEYLEELEQDCGEELDFDPIALRYDFSEYTKSELMDAYWSTLVWWDGEEYKDLTDEKKFENLRDFIEQNTALLVVDDNTYIILDF